MIVRSPLPPWISASHSIERSQNCQNGDAHRPATKAKLIRCTPPSRMFMISRWPSTRMISASPEIRMNSQLYNSKLLRRGVGRRGARGLANASGSGLTSVTPEHDSDGSLQHEERAGEHHGDPDHGDRPQHRLLVLW